MIRRRRSSVRQRLEIVRRNAERLRRMIEDLLLVGLLDAGMLTLEQRPVALPALVRDTVAQLLPHAQARDVALVVEAPADGLIQADPRRLQEVVENLLGNAVKFTKPGTEVVVRVAPAAPAGSCRSVTMARASRLPCARASSNGSSAARTRTGAGYRVPAWAWPSCKGS